jgi:predicted oxidoreductase
VNAAPGTAAGLSPVVAGAWRLLEWQATVADTRAWIAERLALGVTSFDFHGLDGAPQVESLFGQALAGLPGARDRMQLIGRCPGGRDAPATVRAHVQATLAALGTDHLDLLLVHRLDPGLDMAALADALQRLRDAGLVRRFGACAAAAAPLAALHARLALVAHQIELSVLHTEPCTDGTLAQAQALGLAALAWSPMAGGRLFTATDDASQRLRGALQSLATSQGVPLPVLAMAWLARQPGRPQPVVGARRTEVVQWAIDALTLELDPAICRQLDATVRSASVDARRTSERSCGGSMEPGDSR